MTKETAPQNFRIERQIRAPRALVWEALLEVLSAAGYAVEGDPPPHGRGSRIAFRIGDYDLVEETLSFEPPSRRRYALVGGAPLDTYEATIAIEVDEEGCRLDWSYVAGPGAHPDAATFLGRARQALTFAADNIVVAAEGRHASSNRGVVPGTRPPDFRLG